MASQASAQAAIFAAVEIIAKSATEDYSGPHSAAMLRDVAIAFRAAAGGQQPGVVQASSN